jgi:succinate-acetate transporter protein
VFALLAGLMTWYTGEAFGVSSFESIIRDWMSVFMYGLLPEN